MSAFASITELAARKALSLTSSAPVPMGFSGTDIRASVYIPPDKVLPGHQVGSFKSFAELQTLTVTSHRGVAPVRVLGEHFAREYVRGGRTVAGSMVFTLFEADVFREIYSFGRTERRDNPYIMFVDQLPPFTITITAINELGKVATMALFDVVLLSNGQTMSVDDVFTETTYQYVAKWATPFMDLGATQIMDKFLRQELEFDKSLNTYIPKLREAHRSLE